MLARYFVDFIIYSFLGWVWESIYCTLKNKRWSDRGFLFGPVCPIYGFCVVTLYFLSHKLNFLSNENIPMFKIFLICAAGSAIAEFSTSWFLEKRFHARWWDYSEMPLNLNGRICLPISILFGLAGLAIVKFLFPVMSKMHLLVPDIAYEAAAMIFSAVLGADIALTEASLSSLLKDIENMHKEFNEKAESTYFMVSSVPQKMRDSVADKMDMVKEQLSSTSELIKGGVSETASYIKARIDINPDNLSVTALLEKYTPKMSFGKKLSLKHIKKFMPSTKEEQKTFYLLGKNLFIGDTLKDALDKTETKKKLDKKNKENNEADSL